MIKIKNKNQKLSLITLIIISWGVYLFSLHNVSATIVYTNAVQGQCPSDLLKLAQGISDYASSNDARINMKINPQEGICTYKVIAKSSDSIIEVVNILDNIINNSVKEQNSKYEFCKILQNSINPSSKLLVDVFQKAHDKSYLAEFENVEIMIRYYMNSCNFGKSFTPYSYLKHSNYIIESNPIGIKDIVIPVLSSIVIIFLVIIFL